MRSCIALSATAILLSIATMAAACDGLSKIASGTSSEKLQIKGAGFLFDDSLTEGRDTDDRDTDASNGDDENEEQGTDGNGDDRHDEQDSSEDEEDEDAG